MSTLDSMLTELMEETVRRAFLAGHAAALRGGQQEAPDYAYEDWRGWGPGVHLPGGPEASKALRAKHGEPPQWPAYSSKITDAPDLNGRTVVLETRHGLHPHIATVVLDLAQAQRDAAYVDYAIDRMTRSLRADIESCTK